MVLEDRLHYFIKARRLLVDKQQLANNPDASCR